MLLSLYICVCVCMPIIFFNHVYVVKILSTSVNAVFLMSAMGKHVNYR